MTISFTIFTDLNNGLMRHIRYPDGTGAEAIKSFVAETGSDDALHVKLVRYIDNGEEGETSETVSEWSRPSIFNIG